MEAKNSLRFGRGKRLQSTEEFARLKQNGRRLVKGCLIVNWMEGATNAREPLRLGVVTPRNIGPSVARSRARRLMRESFRQNQGRLKKPVSLVLIGRPSISGKSFADVEKDYLNLMRQAKLLAEE